MRRVADLLVGLECQVRRVLHSTKTRRRREGRASRVPMLELLEPRLCLDAYKLELLVETGVIPQELTAISPNVSINDAGQVAFIGDTGNGTGVFVADGPGNYRWLSFEPNPDRDFGVAAAINDRDEVEVSARDRISGDFLLRRWQVPIGTQDNWTLVATTYQEAGPYVDLEPGITRRVSSTLKAAMQVCLQFEGFGPGLPPICLTRREFRREMLPARLRTWFLLPPGVIPMSVATLQPSASCRFAMPPEPVLPLTVGQYHAMIRAGALESGAPIELLEGWLVTKMTKNPPHSASTAKTRRWLNDLIPDGWSVDSQEPVTTADSEPEPDVAVIRGLREEYVERHPGPEDVGLLVEVAETSLDRDRGWKKRIYAVARIPVYWIVNLVDRQVEVFTNPSGPGEQPDYGVCQVFVPGDQVPVVLDRNEVGRIAVHDLLP